MQMQDTRDFVTYAAIIVIKKKIATIPLFIKQR